MERKHNIPGILCLHLIIFHSIKFVIQEQNSVSLALNVLRGLSGSSVANAGSQKGCNACFLHTGYCSHSQLCWDINISFRLFACKFDTTDMVLSQFTGLVR